MSHGQESCRSLILPFTTPDVFTGPASEDYPELVLEHCLYGIETWCQLHDQQTNTRYVFYIRAWEQTGLAEGLTISKSDNVTTQIYNCSALLALLLLYIISHDPQVSSASLFSQAFVVEAVVVYLEKTVSITGGILALQIYVIMAYCFKKNVMIYNKKISQILQQGFSPLSSRRKRYFTDLLLSK